MAKISKQRLLFGAFLLVLIVVAELFFHRLAIAAWPVFLVMIFFFEAHMSKEKVAAIIVGGATGILCYVLTVQAVTLLADVMDPGVARLLSICVIVYAIVAFGEVVPMVFNNYAFMFYLVSGLAARADGAEPWLWLAVVSVGGALIVLAILGIARLTARLLPE